MSKLNLVSADGKRVGLVEHVMRKVGDDIQVTIDGVTGLARKNEKRNLTYVTVGEVAMRVPTILEDGGVYTTEEWTPKTKPVELDADGNPIKKERKPRAPKAEVVDPETGEVVAKPKKTRKPKVEEEEAAA